MDEKAYRALAEHVSRLDTVAGQLGAEMILTPAFDFFPPPTQWGRRALVSSAYQHAI